MTCAAQAAEVLGPLMATGERFLDAGCGGGYYYWSFVNRGFEIEYHGLDYTPEMIELARAEMEPRAGLPEDRFRLAAIEDLDETFDTILCFNVLTNSPHYARPFERLLRCARKRLLLRESLGERLIVDYRPDLNLDDDKRHIHVYHNTYPIAEVVAFMEEFGFRVTRIPDARTGDGVELVCDVAHSWRILLAERT